VQAFLTQRIQAAVAAGISPERLIVDPGFGFGKTLEHNLALFRALPLFAEMGFPLLVGLSRKSMIGTLLNRPVDQRQMGSVAAALLAAQRGARIIRVHDVAATRDVLQILQAIDENLSPQ